MQAKASLDQIVRVEFLAGHGEHDKAVADFRVLDKITSDQCLHDFR